MLLLTMIFVAGVLHGLGPDHLAAITAFGAITGHSFRRLAFFSVRFALGHAVVICGAALLAHFVRVTLPLTWERGFDLAAAALLLIHIITAVANIVTSMLTLASRRNTGTDTAGWLFFWADYSPWAGLAACC